jgi:hypothetical protein
MPQSRQRRTSRTQPIDHRLVIATSLQEAATWLKQAEQALAQISNDHPTGNAGYNANRYELYLERVGRNIKRIHNNYSRIKMP